MDLSFSKTLELQAAGASPPGAVRMARMPVLLVAAAARQAASPTSRALALVLRGQDDGNDHIQALAHIFAPRSGGGIDAACLAGSFHPGVGAMMMVGTIR